MLSKIASGTVAGIKGKAVTVETELIKGLQAFHVVGLPETAVRESRLRVQSALRHSGFQVPHGKITVNLAPAELPKRGALLDLAIAISVLVASKQIPANAVEGCGFIGELSLTGEVRKGRGLLPIVDMGVRSGWARTFIPREARGLCSLLSARTLRPVSDLRDVVQILCGPDVMSCNEVPSFEGYGAEVLEVGDSLDMGHVHGQEEAKRAALIAVAGNHNLLLSGPPGCGKSMIAARLPSLLPRLTREEALQIQLIRSVADGEPPDYASLWRRPFRAPHHSATQASLLGGGAPVRPGEVSLAHGGVLFLDELPEYKRGVLESLREPLETGEVIVSRVKERLRLPASFMLVAAMNPCPCGFWGVKGHSCVCFGDEVGRYRRKLSGPILDRIDLVFHMPRVGFSSLAGTTDSKTSEDLRNALEVAREVQRARKDSMTLPKSTGESSWLMEHGLMTLKARKLLEFLMEERGLGARGGTKLLRVSRTIADLDGAQRTCELHVGEAMAYRGPQVMNS